MTLCASLVCLILLCTLLTFPVVWSLYFIKCIYQLQQQEGEQQQQAREEDKDKDKEIEERKSMKRSPKKPARKASASSKKSSVGDQVDSFSGLDLGKKKENSFLFQLEKRMPALLSFFLKKAGKHF